MAVRRTVRNNGSARMEQSRDFYTEVLGLDLAMDMGWIMTFVSPINPTAQISVLSRDASTSVVPNISVEVDDVNAVHAAAVRQGAEIVYPLTDEPWGVRRFVVADPNGTILNVLSHHQTSDAS